MLRLHGWNWWILSVDLCQFRVPFRAGGQPLGFLPVVLSDLSVLRRLLCGSQQNLQLLPADDRFVLCRRGNGNEGRQGQRNDRQGGKYVDSCCLHISPMDHWVRVIRVETSTAAFSASLGRV